MLIKLAILAATAVFISPAMATTVTFQLSGSQFTSCADAVGGAACDGYAGGPLDLTGTSFDGTISLDLAALGLPHLANRTIAVSVDPFGDGAAGVSVDLNFIGPRFHMPTGAAAFSMVTDGKADPVSWFVDVLDGPPDYFVGTEGLSAFYPDPVFWDGVPGTLKRITPAPIPLPPAVFLLIGGLGLLGMLGRLRR
jgi:hypothetical protein